MSQLLMHTAFQENNLISQFTKKRICLLNLSDVL